MKKSFYQLIGWLCFMTLSFATTAHTSFSKDQGTTIFETLNNADILDVTIRTHLDSLVLQKKTNKQFVGTFSYMDATGKTVNRAVKVRPRGRSRRLACDFPPLKIKFLKKGLKEDQIRAQHKSLKLVTHCNDEGGSLSNVLEEYLAYKIYNELTENSLKVQLVRLTYEDIITENSFKRYGILIEDVDELAERMGGKKVEGFGKTLEDCAKKERNTFAMFQYMIGNEDWRVEFMRNVKFVEMPNQKQVIPIPYDFDAAGIVAAKYARPDRDLRLESVRQRAFMGRIDTKEDRQTMIDLFNAKKTKIYQLIDAFKPLNRVNKTELLAYLDAFYEIINTPKYLKMAIPLKGKRSVPTAIDGHFES